MDNKLHPDTVAMLAAPHMRLGHYLWHGSRNMWELLTAEQRGSFEQKFGWTPPRPALGTDGKPIVSHGLGPGLDFLFMHRHMIREVNKTQPTGSKIKGWAGPPAVGDPNYPVPADLPHLDGKNDATWRKGVDAWNARWEHLDFESLSEAGTFLEYGLHVLMHERWATLGPGGSYRMTPPVGGDWPTPDARWDVPEYNTLYDPYASHVHPLFWSIHGWIDGLIDVWENKRGTVDWTGAWLGPMDHHAASGGLGGEGGEGGEGGHGGHGGHATVMPSSGFMPSSSVEPKTTVNGEKTAGEVTYGTGRALAKPLTTDGSGRTRAVPYA